MIHTQENYEIRKEAQEFPMMIVLSFSYVCNAKCPNCPYNNSNIRDDYKDSKFMPWELFKKIADEAGQYGTVLRFSGGGEPMLNPNIEKCVTYANQMGCKTSIITNGSVMTLPKLDKADTVEFSVDAGCEDEYLIARPGLNWAKLNQNITQQRKHGKSKIIASIINQKGIDVVKAEEYWRDKVDKVQIRKYLTWGYNEDKSADPTPYLPPEKHIPCPWLFERLNIDSFGNVTFCGEDIAFQYKFANINDKSIKDIWLGKEFQDIRKKHLDNQGHTIQMCSQCPDWKYRTWTYNYWALIGT